MTKQGVIKEDLFRLKFFTEAKMSPDGKKIVYVQSQVDAEADKEYKHLWLLDMETNATLQLTSGDWQDSNVNWSPDGKSLAFLSSRTKLPQIFILPLDGGEARQVTEMKTPIGEGPVWSPDGQYLAFAASAVEPRDPNEPYRITRKIYRFDGVGYLDETLLDVYRVSVQGGEAQRLTNDQYMNTGLKWSPDGQEIMYQASMHPGSYDWLVGISAVNMQGQVREIVPMEWGMAGENEYTPDGLSIIFAGVEVSRKMGYKTDLWSVPRLGGDPVNLTPDFEYQIGGGLQGDMPASPSGQMLFDKDANGVYINVQKGGSVNIYYFPLDGSAPKQITDDDCNISLVGVSAEKLCYLKSTWFNPQDLYTARLDGSEEQRLTELNREVVDTWKQPEVVNIKFKGWQDREVEGWLMKPTVGEAPYPTISYVHGGPTGAFGNTFSFDFQMLAGAGYAVLFINFHGSTGYGNDFALALNEHMGEADYIDVINSNEYVIEQGLADKDRLGICGLSYGGYMTCWAVTQTTRFKAAVGENPVGDMISDYGVGDMSIEFDLSIVGGPPHEVYEDYQKCSPVEYAHNCTTPTLLMQGEADYRCPALNSEQFYTMLRVNRCITEMLRFPNSSHVASIAGDIPVRKAQNDGLLDWFDRFILGKTRTGK